MGKIIPLDIFTLEKARGGKAGNKIIQIRIHLLLHFYEAKVPNLVETVYVGS